MAAAAKASMSHGPPKSHVLDELVMGTNSSSIVSKRSVEKLYFPEEPHYFRYFVKKFQRRAPLINRGYWLRLRAIDVVVRQFLFENRSTKKIVINLGCGSDVLPWQSHARHALLCDDVLFVDVDYPDLMLKKRSIVLETPQLSEILGENFVVSQSDEDQILLRSDRYCQIGCDLREISRLRHSLETLSPLADCHVLFVAEVSITYMDTKFADALIHWSSSVGKAEFCLLEQLLPNGPDHPFAATMLSHFDKLKTPPKSVSKYPTLAKQVSRFTGLGYTNINIWDLWEAWSSAKFVSSSERSALDNIEPFDEWEEFVLFGRHYFILHASATHQQEKIPFSPKYNHKEPCEKESIFPVSMVKHDVQTSKRRFGDILAITDPTGAAYAVHIMGLGTAGREESHDIYSLDGKMDMPIVPIAGPPPRMCHSITDLGDYGMLLVGGRTSPANTLSDCWVLHKGPLCKWVPTSSLPIPLFRHAAIRLRGSSLALIVGGKTGPSAISEDCYVFHATKGWSKCAILGEAPGPLFGAVLCNSPARLASGGIFTGLLAGGIGQDGLISSKKYRWKLDNNDSQPTIRFTKHEEEFDQLDDLAVFGAKTVNLESQTLVCGGVGACSRSQGQSILMVYMPDNDAYSVSKMGTCPEGKALPFMVGSAIMEAKDSIVILGGGATCFSMGTFWETGVFQLSFKCKEDGVGSCGFTRHEPLKVRFLASQRIVSSTRQTLRQEANLEKATVATIPRVRLETPAQFEDILRTGLPAIISNANFGGCVQKWTPSYMIDRIGYNTKVVAHECKHDHERMDFNSKNFRYVTEPFGKVMERAEAGERIYLRALSRDKPSERPANIQDDFSALAEDFCLPRELDSANRCLFSSVLRVSGRINMWLHYDVMANVYAQVAGSKRMVLFPPRDVEHLQFAPGASSSSLNVFSELETSRMAATHPYEAVLAPGDMLFLPPCWPHAAATITDWGIAVNVFFRDLESGYAIGRDVYGNRDLAAYEKGRLEVARVGKSFQHLPLETRRFYLKRLAEELESTAEGV
ncbi:Leucine carboxyl methyltransferase family [Metarhizium anisopliae]